MDNITTSTQADIEQRTNVWASREMLKHAMPVTVLEKFGKAIKMPKNKSTNAKFRRPKVFEAVKTPLVEGVTPQATQFGYEDVSTKLLQYGMVIVVTDVMEMTHEDPVLNDATEQSGENLGRTIEQLTYGVVRAGTSVIYSGGVTSRSLVEEPMTKTKQRAATRFLKSQKAKKFTKILSGSTNYSTTPVEAAYVAIAHTDCESDIRNMDGFIPTAKYGSKSVLCPEEIGAVDDVRYVLSPDLEAFEGAGSANTNGVLSTDGNVDVYPIIFLGMEAYGVVAIRGAGSVDPTVIPPSQKTKEDPLGQRGYVGWKTWFAALILNQTWMTRVECAVSAL